MKKLNYKKKIVAMFLIFLTVIIINLCSFSLTFTVSAEGKEIDDDTKKIIDEQAEIFNTDEIFNSLPQNVKEILEKYNLNEINFQALGQMEFWDFFNIVLALFQNEISKPIKTILVTVVLLVLSAIIDSYKTNLTKKSMGSVFSVISVLVVMTAISLPINECIQNAQKTIESSKNFMLGFIPVFTGVLSASGQSVTASAYSMIMFGLTELTSLFILTALVPFLNIYLALCLTSGMNESFNLSSTADVIKKTINFILIFTTTVFIGFWSLQTIVTSSADTVALKTTKLAVASFVPVVGGVISETLNSVTACLSLVKSSIGVFAIIAIIFTYLPTLLSCIAFLAATSLSSAFSQMLGNNKIGNLFKAVGNVLKLLISLICCYMLLMIVSITIILSLTNQR